MNDLLRLVVVVLFVALVMDGLVWICRRHRSSIRIWFGIDKDEKEDKDA